MTPQGDRGAMGQPPGHVGICRGVALMAPERNATLMRPRPSWSCQDSRLCRLYRAQWGRNAGVTERVAREYRDGMCSAAPENKTREEG